MSLNNLFELLILKGGKGSGNWGHAGKVGQRGGSAPKSGVGAVMSLRSGPSAEKRRLEAKGVTEQQKTPAGTPVSSALDLSKLPSKGETPLHVRNTIDIIDSIHGDGDLPNSPLVTKPLKRNWGLYYPGNNRIVINPKGEHPMMTTSHEIGHLIDFKGFGKDRGTSVYPVTQSVKKIVDVIKNSKAYKNLDSLKNKEVVTTYTDKSGVTREYKHKGDRKYISYLKKPDESFARAYSQYIATKSKHPKMNAELNNARKSPYTSQWDDDDFKPIEKAFDDMFAERGWIK